MFIILALMKSTQLFSLFTVISEVLAEKKEWSKLRLELNLAKDTKNKNKVFYRYVNQRRKVREGVLPLPSRQCWKLGNCKWEGWGTQQLFHLSLQWQPLFLHILSGWTAGWGRREQSSWSPEEPECTLSICIPGSWGNWLMSMPSHSPYLKSHDSYRKNGNILAIFKTSRKEDLVSSLTSWDQMALDQFISISLQ